MQNSVYEFSEELRKIISNTGASAFGFTKAQFLKNDYDFFINWLKKGYHAGKSYLEKNQEKRANPALLLQNCQSVISVLFSYHYNSEPSQQHYKISKYALGKDYHIVIKVKLQPVVDFIIKNTQSPNTRLFVDTAPIFEKAWAKRCGLGWIGKNTLLIHKTYGSYHFIGTILTDIVLDYDNPTINTDICGHCTKCIDACPTQALVNPYELDSRRCISHLTIEHKNELPEIFKNKFNGYIFGCDICQDVCPYNKNIPQTTIKEFFPNSLLKNTDWENISEKEFATLAINSPLKRINYTMLKRNINFVKITSS